MVSQALAEKIYKSFYTKSDPIVYYMVKMLNLSTNMTVFEPCAGDGVFIDAVLKAVPSCLMVAFELNPNAIKTLKVKYRNNRIVNIVEGDTLTDPNLLWKANAGGVYDRIIANPPYGGWQDYRKRKLLKKLFPTLYVKETYSVFLYRCIQLLKENGILTFIIPDTYLNLHMHTKLREFILTKTKILEIVLFPSSFFPGVNFGYSNLSIITLQKCSKRDICLEHIARVISGFNKVDELVDVADKHDNKFNIYCFTQKQIFNNIDHALFVNGNPEVMNLINKSSIRTGDIAECVTGFYSGNDKQYLRVAKENVKNTSKYKVINSNLICNNYGTREDLLDGIEGNKCFVPIIKGGGIKFYKSNLWFIDWSKEAVKEYKNSKKARFQNSSFYFKEGIGVPMISSSQITASILENRLFDQSIVGIFPKDRSLLFYLLAFFNTPTCNKLIRTINPSANNPANYIKKIPVLFPSSKSIQSEIEGLTKNIIAEMKEGGGLDCKKYKRIIEIFFDIYGF